jgi:hypothetical protein
VEKVSSFLSQKEESEARNQNKKQLVRTGLRRPCNSRSRPTVLYGQAPNASSFHALGCAPGDWVTVQKTGGTPTTFGIGIGIAIAIENHCAKNRWRLRLRLRSPYRGCNKKLHRTGRASRWQPFSCPRCFATRGDSRLLFSVIREKSSATMHRPLIRFQVEAGPPAGTRV